MEELKDKKEFVEAIPEYVKTKIQKEAETLGLEKKDLLKQLYEYFHSKQLSVIEDVEQRMLAAYSQIIRKYYAAAAEGRKVRIRVYQTTHPETSQAKNKKMVTTVYGVIRPEDSDDDGEGDYSVMSFWGAANAEAAAHMEEDKEYIAEMTYNTRASGNQWQTPYDKDIKIVPAEDEQLKTKQKFFEDLMNNPQSVTPLSDIDLNVSKNPTDLRVIPNATIVDNPRVIQFKDETGAVQRETAVFNVKDESLPAKEARNKSLGVWCTPAHIKYGVGSELHLVGTSAESRKGPEMTFVLHWVIPVFPLPLYEIPSENPPDSQENVPKTLSEEEIESGIEEENVFVDDSDSAF